MTEEVRNFIEKVRCILASLLYLSGLPLFLLFICVGVWGLGLEKE